METNKMVGFEYLITKYIGILKAPMEQLKHKYMSIWKQLKMYHILREWSIP